MKYTKQQLLAASPCVDGLLFAKSCKFDFVKIWRTCDRGDWLMWLLRQSGVMDKTMAVKIAIACAAHVLEKFEAKYPDDKRPRQAIAAAQSWLVNPTQNNAAAAAAAAASAASAAASASAAAAAAYASASAADAAAAAYRHSKTWREARAAKLRSYCDIVRESLACPWSEEK